MIQPYDNKGIPKSILLMMVSAHIGKNTAK